LSLSWILDNLLLLSFFISFFISFNFTIVNIMKMFIIIIMKKRVFVL